MIGFNKYLIYDIDNVLNLILVFHDWITLGGKKGTL